MSLLNPKQGLSPQQPPSATPPPEIFEDASSWYGYSNKIDQIREENFSRFKNVTFLDAAGTPPYCEKAVELSSQFLSTLPLSNPHSNNVTSIFTTNLTNHVRNQVYKHFNTDSEHYSLIFTHNTSHSCFLLADAFPWKKYLSMCAYFQEAHHSLLGVRHTAISRRAITIPMTLADFELIKIGHPHQDDKERDKENVRVRKDISWNETVLDDIFEKIYSHKNFTKRYQKDRVPAGGVNGASLALKPKIDTDPHRFLGILPRFPKSNDSESEDDDLDEDEEDQRMVWNLLTITLESNFSGEKFPLSIIKHIQEQNTKLLSQKFASKHPDLQSKGLKYRHQWKIFVDAAAYVPSAPLDLSEYPIDFLSFSYSKVFGYPTGLGVLLIKKDIMTEMEAEKRTLRPFYLRRNFFSGGTVLGAISNTEERHFWHTTPSYCYLADSSYFSMSDLASSTGSFSSLQGSRSPQPRSPRGHPMHRSTSAQSVKAEMMKAEESARGATLAKERQKHRAREKEREKIRKARNYLSDLELDRQFEDGTIPYTSILSLGFCYSFWEKWFTDFHTIQKHTYYLSQYLYLGLKALKYNLCVDGSGFTPFPMCEIYGSHHLECPDIQGPIVSFNIVCPPQPKNSSLLSPAHDLYKRFPETKEKEKEKDKGNVKRYVPHKEVEEKSKRWNICLRSGAFCNTGSSQTVFKYSERKYKQHLESGGTCTESTVFELGAELYGAARVSLSYMSTKQDVDQLLRFVVVEWLIPLSPGPVGEPYSSWDKVPLRESSTPAATTMSVEKLFSV